MELSIYTAMIFLSENSWVIVNVYEAIRTKEVKGSFVCAFVYGSQRKRQPEGHNKRSTVSPVHVYGLYEFHGGIACVGDSFRLTLLFLQMRIYHLATVYIFCKTIHFLSVS